MKLLGIRRFRGSFFIFMLIAAAGAPLTADAVPPCAPGGHNCIPSPNDCASGQADGIWASPDGSHVAVCAGAAGHTVAYAGGNPSTPCGSVVAVDATIFYDPDPGTCAPFPAPPGTGSRFREAVAGPSGVVVSISPAATQAGIDVLRRGGNAIDAAVTIVFAVGVARPEMCGIGGRGFLLYRSAAGQVAALDFQSTSPGALTADDVGGTGLHNYHTGRQVTGVPGTVAGMAAALHRYGSISLAEAVAPAERLAREGVIVTPEHAALYTGPEANAPVTGSPVPQSNTLRMRAFPASADVYLKHGVFPYAPGDRLIQTDYANSLKLIGDDGPEAFYKGPIARLIVEGMKRPSRYPGDRGLLTMEDFTSYEARWREPITATYRGRQVIAMPPPSSALAVVEMTNILEGFDLSSAGYASADHLHLVAEAQKIAFADRDRYVADPDRVAVPVELLTSKVYAAQRRTEIDMAHAKSYGAGEGSDSSAGESGHTTHVAVVDADGNAVSVTCTLGLLYGSAYVAPGTGFLMADVVDFSHDAASANSPQGGKRPAAAMSPMIVVDGGVPILVTGGAGGQRIPGGVFFAVSNTIDFGLDVARALDFPRSDEQQCCVMSVEDARFPASVLDDLESRGHILVREREYAIGPWIQAAGIDLRTRRHVAAGDPRAERAPAAA